MSQADQRTTTSRDLLTSGGENDAAAPSTTPVANQTDSAQHYVITEVTDVVANRLHAARDDEIMRLLGANTDNPVELLEALRQIQAAPARQQASSAYQLPGAMQTFGPPGSVAATPSMATDRRN